MCFVWKLKDALINSYQNYYFFIINQFYSVIFYYNWQYQSIVFISFLQDLSWYYSHLEYIKKGKRTFIVCMHV